MHKKPFNIILLLTYSVVQINAELMMRQRWIVLGSRCNLGVGVPELNNLQKQHLHFVKFNLSNLGKTKRSRSYVNMHKWEFRDVVKRAHLEYNAALTVHWNNWPTASLILQRENKQ